MKVKIILSRFKKLSKVQREFMIDTLATNFGVSKEELMYDDKKSLLQISNELEPVAKTEKVTGSSSTLPGMSLVHMKSL